VQKQGRTAATIGGDFDRKRRGGGRRQRTHVDALARSSWSVRTGGRAGLRDGAGVADDAACSATSSSPRCAPSWR
jgi:hypothetical protein